MRTFLSIGSGPGMGLATAERFAKEGFLVVLSARNEAKTRELANQLKAKGHSVEPRTVDAGNPLSVASLVADVEKRFGSIDVLHYNAASMRKGTSPSNHATLSTQTWPSISGVHWLPRKRSSRR